MSQDGYQKFFSKAQDAAKEKSGAKPRFKIPPPKASAKSDEAKLRAAFKIKKRRPPFPWKAVAGLSVTLFCAGAYLVAPETVERLADKIEIRAMGAAGAEEKPAENAKPDPDKKAKAAGAAANATTAKPADEKSGEASELSHFEKLKQRKEELDQREKELSELEEELQKQKVELDKRITQLEEMRNQIAQTLKDRVEVDQEKVNKLVDLYSNMKPKQAADILGSLNEELAVEVLSKMKKKNAAEIMNLLPPEKARILSEKYTGYRRNISSQEPKG